jgi:hypothetical protein
MQIILSITYLLSLNDNADGAPALIQSVARTDREVLCGPADKALKVVEH